MKSEIFYNHNVEQLGTDENNNNNNKKIVRFDKSKIPEMDQTNLTHKQTTPKLCKSTQVTQEQKQTLQ